MFPFALLLIWWANSQKKRELSTPNVTYEFRLETASQSISSQTHAEHRPNSMRFTCLPSAESKHC